MIEGVPLVRCPHCGESYFTAATLQEIECNPQALAKVGGDETRTGRQVPGSGVASRRPTDGYPSDGLSTRAAGAFRRMSSAPRAATAKSIVGVAEPVLGRGSAPAHACALRTGCIRY
ncbi:MAG: YgiT-type zinc finger protein [Candidatus Binatia bacterium]